MDAARQTASRRPRRTAAFVAVVLSMLALTSCDARRFVTGWLPHWMPATSTQTFVDGAPVFEEVSPFRYATYDSPDKIVPIGTAGAFDQVIAEARAQGIPVIPTIVDQFPARGMAKILADPDKRQRHIDAIVDLVVSSGYDGADLDYEKFAFSDGSSTWESLKPNWIDFVTELGAELHAHEKLLSVTVPAIWIDQWGNRRGYWSYAWDEIEPSIDRLRVMVYDWSYGRPGPIAPIWWVRQVLTYAESVVPMGKVQLGIPAYGREWTAETRGTCPSDVVPATKSWTMRQIPGIVAERGVTPSRHIESGEMTFSYQTVVKVTPPSTTTTTVKPTTTTQPSPTTTAVGGTPTSSTAAVPTSTTMAPAPTTTVAPDKCTITREVWYPDASSWRNAARAAIDAGATGVAVWALGYESPEARDAIADLARSIVGPDGTEPVGRLGRVRVGDSGRLRLRGWAFDPEGDLPITVTLTATSLDDPTTAPVVRTVLARLPKDALETKHPGAGVFHAFRVLMTPPAPGDYRVCGVATGRYAGPATNGIGCRPVTVPDPDASVAPTARASTPTNAT